MSDEKESVGAQSGRNRRSWNIDEKRRIVDETLEDGASIAEVARRHDLNANQLFGWRRQFGVEPMEPKEVAALLPLTITPETMSEERDVKASGQMEIVLADGDRILVWPDVDTAALTRVLKAMSRR